MPPSNAGLPHPNVFITLGAWQELMAYTQRSPEEINGYGWVERVGNDFVIYEVFILDQEVSAAHATSPGKALSRYMYEAIKAGRNPAGLRFQWHSHALGSAYASCVDEAYIEGDPGQYFITMVVNHRGDRYCRLDLYRPFRWAGEMSVNLLIPPLPVERQGHIIQEITAKVRHRVDRLLRRPRLDPAFPQLGDVAVATVHAPEDVPLPMEGSS
jgi:hypothetical protein